MLLYRYHCSLSDDENRQKATGSNCFYQPALHPVVTVSVPITGIVCFGTLLRISPVRASTVGTEQWRQHRLVLFIYMPCKFRMLTRGSYVFLVISFYLYGTSGLRIFQVENVWNYESSPWTGDRLVTESPQDNISTEKNGHTSVARVRF
jgi:hypothetical protein